MNNDVVNESIETQKDLGTDDTAIARRWKLELKLADKRERDWRDKVKKIYDIYSPKDSSPNTFNILWSNTETMRHAVYNSLPQPVCRRRYSDEDPLGLQVGEVLTRALEFSQDTYDFNSDIQGDVLSMLLAGRAVSRVRYIPTIQKSTELDIQTSDKTMDVSTPEDASEDYMNDESEESSEDSSDTVDVEDNSEFEELGWEQVICQRVRYDDFRILCAAKEWDEVTAIGFKHRLSREDLIEKFGESVGAKIPLDETEDVEIRKSEDSDLFKTAEIWEIWDKEEKQVIWISKEFATPCKIQNDPLGLQGFFPCPRPIYAIENDQSLIPTPIYSQYEQQAKELNKISLRINKLIDALRNRGVYDATLSELSELMRSGDNDLVPSQNVTALLERGGLEKAIWMLPIQNAAMVLKELYAQRDHTKQIIYELTGISDIMRSASDPNETYGAQKIKTQWGTQRLQRMQSEVQRYVRDLLRLKAEIISEKFQIETLEQMTLVQLPHKAEVMAKMHQIMAQYQQQVMQAHMSGQQPPTPPQLPPMPVTWEDVIDNLRNDSARSYRIDIETDSTISSTQDSDMQSLRELLTGMSEIIQGFAPAVQAGAIPIEVVKSIMGVVVRRAKLGTTVEEAMNKMQQPAPQPDPNQVKANADMQKQQMQQQHEMQMAQMHAQVTQASEQARAQADAQAQQARANADSQIQQIKLQSEAQLEYVKQKMQFQMDEAERNHQVAIGQMQQKIEALHALGQASLDKWKAELESSTKIMVAQIAAKAGLDAAAIQAENTADNSLNKSYD